MILAAKRIHFDRIISNSENKTKSTWKIINKENGKYKGRQHPQFLKGNNKLIFNQEDMANIFNNYFLSVADLLNKENKDYKNNIKPLHYLQNYLSKTFNIMKWKYVTTYEMEKIIKSLNSKNSYGYDEISTKTIKLSSPFIISSLTRICNEILKTGIFPDRLKYALVKPIYKKGNKCEITTTDLFRY